MYQLIEEASQVLRTPPPVFDFENPAEPKRDCQRTWQRQWRSLVV